MQCDLFKTLWGHQGSFESAALLASAAGFTGIEAPAPEHDDQRAELAQVLRRHGLRYISEICTTGSYVPDRHATPDEHLQSLEQKIQRSLPLEPLFFNVMGGCDAWSLDVQIDFFGRAQALADRLGVLCSFETHRGRSFFNPWVTRDVLRALPDLRITCDFSHWVVVCERLMDSEWETILEVAERAHHIHGRVGYDQGPQVPHPAAPEYAEALASHERCWQAIWASQVRRGYRRTTMTPEFGPDGYLHTLPFTHQPVADLWQVNSWIGKRQQDQFTRWLDGQRAAAVIEE
ncbi:TIM barrel protein [Halopseudomonas aestusnigri]|uniref:sugar phosphate isomerase/epimerase family protein n=1 Tax=Halopseudomonas aestusnigri TaxID=857252 RepID=UPI002557523C|nr:TIM barrel protein [Halopseudomonas aestusnigri]MDL2198707.1 TIM barrel protein [Halopseudomonas aestusnigri]